MAEESNTGKKIVIGSGIALALFLFLKNKTYGFGPVLGGGAGNTTDLAADLAKLNQEIKKLEDNPGTGITKIPVTGLRLTIPHGTNVFANVRTKIDGQVKDNYRQVPGLGVSYRIKNISYNYAGAQLIVETEYTCALEQVITPGQPVQDKQVCTKLFVELKAHQRGFIKQD